MPQAGHILTSSQLRRGHVFGHKRKAVNICGINVKDKTKNVISEIDEDFEEPVTVKRTG